MGIQVLFFPLGGVFCVFIVVSFLFGFISGCKLGLDSLTTLFALCNFISSSRQEGNDWIGNNNNNGHGYGHGHGRKRKARQSLKHGWNKTILRISPHITRLGNSDTLWRFWEGRKDTFPQFAHDTLLRFGFGLGLDIL